jgi:GTP-binding protein
MADVPGLIEGAAEGAGLGIRFLRHLVRTGLLLQLVDIAPIDGGDPGRAARAIDTELGKYSAELAAKPRWLVINKIDLLPAEELAAARRRLVESLDWDGPVFEVSAATGAGTAALAQALARELEVSEESAGD